METTHLPPPSGEGRSPGYSVLGLPVEVAATALGLQALVGASNLLHLHPLWIARRLFPTEDPRLAADRVELHVLQLEDAGIVSTWAEDGLEWLSMRPWPSVPPSAVTAPPAPPPFVTEPTAQRPAFSSAGERERAREEARERARAQANAEEQARRERWARWEDDYITQVPKRPKRPLTMDAPPIGCPDHPHGSLTSCGPCGTQSRRYREWLDREQYTEKLAMFEQPIDEETPDDDEPF